MKNKLKYLIPLVWIVVVVLLAKYNYQYESEKKEKVNAELRRVASQLNRQDGEIRTTLTSRKEELLNTPQSETISNKNFKWTKEDFEKLPEGKLETGVGGANYKEIIAKYGEPQFKSEKDVKILLSYNNAESNDSYKHVLLSFIKQEDGEWLLESKSSYGF